MKTLCLLLIALNITLVGSCAIAQEKMPEKIAAVKSGTLKTAKASWWGYNAEDSAEALQNAIDSGVPQLIIDNVGSDWTVSRPIKLVSNQEIIFEENVVIQAKKGYFKGTNDSLLIGHNVEKSTLTGRKGSTLRMQRDDYANPQLYKKAEWRHGISFIDSKDVIVRGLTVRETGGDGLYLGATPDGFNQNILIEDMVLDANYRLGMAVISAENLTIRRSQFSNTKGTAPQGGLDFEPNFPTQRLVNCVVEDSVFTDNAGGAGIEIYSIKLNSTSLPISIHIKNAQIQGNSLGLKSTIASSTEDTVKGTITFSESTFDHNRVSLYTPADGAQHVFRNSIFDYSKASEKIKARWDNVPIALRADANAKNPTLGNVVFENSTAILENDTEPIHLSVLNKMTLADNVSGTLWVQQNNQKTPYDVEQFVKKTQDYLATINALKPAKTDLAKLTAPQRDAVRKNNNAFYLQGAFEFLQYAEQGQKITLNVRAVKVYDLKTEVELKNPQGEVIKTLVVPLDGNFHPLQFTAKETGLYRLVRKSTFSQYVDVNSSHRGNGLLVNEKQIFLPRSGRIYFQVPPGVNSFHIGISTDTAADVALIDPDGNEHEKHLTINGLLIFSGERKDVSKNEVWSLEVRDAVWQVGVHLYEPLIPILSTNPGTLLQVP